MVTVKVDEDILICAFRYALGRRTYITSVVADAIEDNADVISDRVRGIIMREIEEADDYGDECDKYVWLNLYDILGRKNKVKEVTDKVCPDCDGRGEGYNEGYNEGQKEAENFYAEKHGQ